MKKALSVALACSMALSLVACGGGSKPTEAPTQQLQGIPQPRQQQTQPRQTQQRHRKQAQRWQTRISL